MGGMGAQGSCMHMTSWFKEIMSCNISEEAISTQVEVRGYVSFSLPLVCIGFWSGRFPSVFTVMLT